MRVSSDRTLRLRLPYWSVWVRVSVRVCDECPQDPQPSSCTPPPPAQKISSRAEATAPRGLSPSYAAAGADLGLRGFGMPGWSRIRRGFGVFFGKFEVAWSWGESGGGLSSVFWRRKVKLETRFVRGYLYVGF